MTEPARRLLEHLRAELREPGLGYAELLTPIAGGYDTRIFAFRLSGAPEPFSIPLILRVLGSQHPPERALSERATQNAVVGLGYPAPRVLLASPDPTILGGAFLVMERLAGRPLLDAQRLGVASVLVEMQLRPHALDAEVLLLALDREGHASWPKRGCAWAWPRSGCWESRRRCAVWSRSRGASSSPAISTGTGAGSLWMPHDWPITKPWPACAGWSGRQRRGSLPPGSPG